ncbi:MraZ [Heracleum sosnowskyi]|uniref:MraZ n=1 Tax=Heracleum sosnowskyi TaxID=360622 RepID=A0AAD8MCZ2_9APIA|nr:MraZ [Heracleum sosnowskyi]
MRPVWSYNNLCWCISAGYLFSLVCSLHGGILTESKFDNLYSQPPKYSSPLNGSVSCEDLQGVGSFETTCLLNANLYINTDLYVFGHGNLEILPHVSVVCPIEGCIISFNLTGNVKVGQYASIVAGSVIFSATSLSFEPDSLINTTSLGGSPPPRSSGTPSSYDGSGGGHGGRGASCLKSNYTKYWGGDVYAWSTLSEPWSYGSKGGGMSAEHQFGGSGGGRVKLVVEDIIFLNGSILAEGGDGGFEGGGGSGGSIIVHAKKLKGFGTISAAGGRGWAGGGGGRISVYGHSNEQEVKVTVHGGLSLGCPLNGGAAGTLFDASILSLTVGNNNVTTETETPLLDFSTSPLWLNVLVENNAKALVPLLWSRVQVRGQISLLHGGILVFGLSEFQVSEFELVADELSLSNSAIKVYGEFRMTVKVLLMWNSKITINDGGDNIDTSSVLEVRNLAVLRGNSVVSSNANLAVYGQGLLTLTGPGDVIKAQRVSLSLFYNVSIGPGSLLQAPLDDDNSKSVVTKSHCGSQVCPKDLLTPPDDCHLNYTLSFSLQICRVEDIHVNGIIKGSIIHIHRATTVIVETNGTISASELGCRNGIGKGNYSNGAGGGAGHGGKGGSGVYNRIVSEGGNTYGSPNLPCELGSGSEGPRVSHGHVSGGGMIVIGSISWPLSRLYMAGSMRADGQSYDKAIENIYGSTVGGLGGGSGGTILLFLEALELVQDSYLSVAGGNGAPLGGGGGGGGRLHFHWSNIDVGNEYVPLAIMNGTVYRRGGTGNSGGLSGEEGTVTGKKCPKGLYGTYCTECPVGTYKVVEGSDASLCTPCSLELLPRRASFVYVRGGAIHSFCPYRCISDKYRMPNCYKPFEELLYTFGGPWPFALLWSTVIVLLAFSLSVLRSKLVGPDCSYHNASSVEQPSYNHSPHLLSLSEVRGSRADKTQTHVHRLYFMGPNTFREPWHLPYSPPSSIIDIVYEDAFNRFIDEINSVAAYNWWEGSVHSILTLVAYPCAWSWKQWCRRNKIHCLQEYVKSEYDHTCLRSCRSRALYKGMKLGATPDLMVAYIDFFLGGDEKRREMVTIIQKRFPMCIIFGGDGSYMSPYYMHSDALLTNLLAQHVPPTVWNRFVDGLNAQLRTVRHGWIHSALIPVINWIKSHGDPQLEFHGVKIELGWFQATASGYYQLGILVVVADHSPHSLHQSYFLESEDCPSPSSRNVATLVQKNLAQPQSSQLHVSHALCQKKISFGTNGGIINDSTLKSLDFRKDFLFPPSLLLHNTRPVGRQDTLQLLISIIFLADIFATALLLLQSFWISLGMVLAILLVLPLSLLSPFPAGLNAYFSRGPRRASLTRVYALWNVTSLSNIIVAIICGLIQYGISLLQPPEEADSMDDEKWWILPTVLMLFKLIQARLLDWHIANLEIRDFSLFCPDPDTFWAYEPDL